MSYSEAQLRAYLAGDFSQDEAMALEALVAQDAKLEARLVALDFGQAAPLRAAFAAVPSPDHVRNLKHEFSDLTAEDKTAFPVKSWLAASIAVVGAFAVAAFAFSAKEGATELSWQEQVAVYQALYVEDTLGSIRSDEAQLTAQLERSAEKLGRALPLDVVGDLQGLDLVRAQVLGIDDKPLIQMAYLSDAGVPVAFCVTEISGSNPGEITHERLSGLDTVHWSDGKFSYMIVGNIDEDRLSDMAESLRDTL